MEKNRKAMLEAIKSGNRIMEVQLMESEGWTKDEMMDLLANLAESQFEKMAQSGDLLSVADLDDYAGERHYFVD